MSQTLPKLSHHLVDEAQYNLLRSVGYLTAAERRDIIDACEFGDIAHIKDKRKSGEPYITHRLRWPRYWQVFVWIEIRLLQRFCMIRSKTPR